MQDPTRRRGRRAGQVVQFLAAPWYLLDSVDTLDKIDRPHLIPITGATIRIIQSTADTTAAKLRAEPPTP
jgi:hypothetical protein